MNELHYQRIDKGLKRRIRSEARNQPRSDKGTFLPIVDPEIRAQIVLSVPDAIRSGRTTREIAAEHNIPWSTLKSWLISDKATEDARGEFLSQELSLRLEEFDIAKQQRDPLALAYAREGFKAWAWIAERREARLFGQKQEITHISADLGERLRRARERILEGEIVDNSARSVDNVSQDQHTSVMSNAPALPKK